MADMQNLNNVNNPANQVKRPEISPEEKATRRKATVETIVGGVVIWILFSLIGLGVTKVMRNKMQQDMRDLRAKYAAELAQERVAQAGEAAGINEEQRRVRRMEPLSSTTVRTQEDDVDSAMLFKQMIDAEAAKKQPASGQQQDFKPDYSAEYEAYQAQLRAIEEARAAAQAQAEAERAALQAQMAQMERQRKEREAQIARQQQAATGGQAAQQQGQSEQQRTIQNKLRPSQMATVDHAGSGVGY